MNSCILARTDTKQREASVRQGGVIVTGQPQFEFKYAREHLYEVQKQQATVNVFLNFSLFFADLFTSNLTCTVYMTINIVIYLFSFVVLDYICAFIGTLLVFIFKI